MKGKLCFTTYERVFDDLSIDLDKSTLSGCLANLIMSCIFKNIFCWFTSIKHGCDVQNQTQLLLVQFKFGLSASAFHLTSYIAPALSISKMIFNFKFKNISLYNKVKICFMLK